MPAIIDPSAGMATYLDFVPCEAPPLRFLTQTHPRQIIAQSETIVRHHSAKTYSELAVKSQAGRVAASGWREGFTVRDNPSQDLNWIGPVKQALRQVG